MPQHRTRATPPDAGPLFTSHPLPQPAKPAVDVRDSAARVAAMQQEAEAHWQETRPKSKKIMTTALKTLLRRQKNIISYKKVGVSRECMEREGKGS